jgi:outer membrane protein assembly factor BamB
LLDGLFGESSHRLRDESNLHRVLAPTARQEEFYVTEREFLLGVAVVAFTLGALALWRTARAVLWRRRAGQRRVWAGLIVRGVLIALLVALGVASLRGAPPPDLVNRPAPASAGAIVAFVQNVRGGYSPTIQAVSARDGATRWTRRLGGAIKSLLSPTPDVVVAQLSANGICALRTRDGAVLWSLSAGSDLVTGPLVADSARVYMVTPAAPARGTGAMDLVALDVLTGAVAWRAPLPAVIQQARTLAVGDGLVFVAGDAAASGSAHNQWEVMALRAADGAPKWVEAGEVIAGANMEVQALVVAGGNVLVEPGSGPLTVLRERDGATAWSGPALPAGANPTTVLNAATSDGTVVYVMSHAFANGSDGSITNFPVRFMALEASDGAVRWSRVLHPDFPVGTLTLSDGVLLSGATITGATAFSGFNPNGSLLTAYDPASGAQLWRDNTPRTGISWDLSAQMTPLGGNGEVYLVGIQSDPYLQDLFTCTVFCPGVSWLYAVNVHTGVPWWRVRTGSVELTHLLVLGLSPRCAPPLRCAAVVWQSRQGIAVRAASGDTEAAERVPRPLRQIDPNTEPRDGLAWTARRGPM